MIKRYVDFQYTQYSQPWRIVLWGFAIFLPHAGVFAVAEEAASPSANVPRYTIHRADSTIRVDGKLDELAWRNAPSVGQFAFPWWKQGRQEQTVARMLWDDKYLYVAFKCQDAHVSAVLTARDDPVFRDDCVELFTSPNPERPREYYNFEMNVNGALLDRYHPVPAPRKLPDWNAKGVLIATEVDGTLNNDRDRDRGWSLEMAIPFANFSQTTGRPHPRDGDIWRLNLNRLGGETNPQHSQWSPGVTAKPSFHTPATFGRVQYSARTASSHALDVMARAGYRAQLDFLHLPPHRSLGACSAVALNRHNTLYLFHRGPQPIMAFDSEGRWLAGWGDDAIRSAHGLRVDADDNLWVTDVQRHVVMKFDPQGKVLMTLGRPDQAGVGKDQFNKPTDIAFARNGDVLVADGYINSRVMKFDRHGKFIREWGSRGSQPGQFHLPHSILVDSTQRVLVGDRENNRIQVFDLDGALLAVWNGFAPYGIAADTAGRVFVADGRANQILQLGRDGSVVARLGSEGHAAGQFDLPHMLATGSDGSIFVAEVGGKRLQKLEPIAAP